MFLKLTLTHYHPIEVYSIVWVVGCHQEPGSDCRTPQLQVKCVDVTVETLNCNICVYFSDFKERQKSDYTKNSKDLLFFLQCLKYSKTHLWHQHCFQNMGRGTAKSLETLIGDLEVTPVGDVVCA